jgi:hypothetical protein
LRRLREVVAAHRAISAVAAIGALVRLVVFLTYQPALEFYGDSFNYLRNASHLAPSYNRPLGYAVTLAIASVTDMLAVVPITQHLAALALGIAIYAVLRRFGCGPLLATVAAAPILLDAYQINIEQFVMAETQFEVLLAGCLGLLLWHERPSAKACAWAGVLLAAATLTRTTGLVLIAPIVVYLVIVRAGMRRIGYLLVAFMIPILLYAGVFKIVRGKFAMTTYDGIFLYGRVGEFADCAKFEVPDYERILCDQLPPQARPGPNFYDWDPNSPRYLVKPPPGMRQVDVTKDFAFRAMKAQPGDYLKIVGSETLHYFRPGKWNGERDWYVDTWRYPTPDRRYRLPYPWHSMVATEGFGHDRVHPHIWRPAVGPLRAYQNVVYTQGPLLAACLLAALLLALRRGKERSAAVWAPLLLATCGLALLVVPSATANFDNRYVLPTLLLFPPAGALAVSRLRAKAKAGVAGSAVTAEGDGTSRPAIAGRN